MNVGAVYSSEDVHIGTRADTTTAIRRGLTVISVSINAQTLGKKRTRAETEEPFIYVKATQGGIIHFGAPEMKKSDGRSFSRMLMKTYGWPVKFFKDIPELLGTLRDAIIGLSV